MPSVYRLRYSAAVHYAAANAARVTAREASWAAAQLTAWPRDPRRTRLLRRRLVWAAVAAVRHAIVAAITQPAAAREDRLGGASA